MAGVSGHIRRPGPGNELHPLNYDATDSRHSIPSHAGWDSVDRCSGPVQPDDWDANSRFPDGPGRWRQT